MSLNEMYWKNNANVALCNQFLALAPGQRVCHKVNKNISIFMKYSN